MPTFLSETAIGPAVQRLMHSRATTGFVNFLILKRALILSEGGKVKFSMKDKPWTQAIKDLTATEPLTTVAGTFRPFVTVFGSSNDTDKYRGEKFLSNGPADTLTGPGWKKIVKTTGANPRNGTLTSGYLAPLPGVVLKSGNSMPDKLDAATWFLRARDLSDIVAADKTLAENCAALTETFKSELGITDDEIGSIFSTTGAAPTGSFEDWFSGTVADPSKYLPDIATAAPDGQGDAKRGDNIIFFGPPGTGKSHKADLLADSSPETIHVLFHPEYTYSDFFGLYKPVVGSDPSIEILAHDGSQRKKPIAYFDFVPGPLLLALANAFANSSESVFLIIDEINRGDCAAIFGDVLQLLDRKQDGSSRYAISIPTEAAAWLDSREVEWHDRDGKLFFPANFTILATMNTSDQGLYPMDSAFKRRWQWQSCSLSFQPVLEFLAKKRPTLHDGTTKWDWEKMILKINDCILLGHLEDKQIGPWFIAPDKKTGAIDPSAFGNKCLYYLWHDVFKDDQLSENSPFNDKPAPIRSFQELQEKFASGGVAAIFKRDVYEGAQVAAPAPAAAQGASANK